MIKRTFVAKMEKRFKKEDMASGMKMPELRYPGYFAMGAPLLFGILWLMSAVIDGEWEFGVKSLSDLGISHDALSAFLFNFGCIMMGSSGVFIGIGCFAYGRSTMRIGGITYAIGLFFLIWVGVFTLPQTMHFVVATTFGIVGGIATVICSISDRNNPVYICLDIILIVISIIAVATQPFEMWEPITTICSMIWTFVLGIKMVGHDGDLFNETPKI